MSDTAINLGYTDLNQAPERQNFEPFPDGTYNMRIIEAAVVDTTKAGGKRLTYKAEVVDGPYVKRMVFGGINIINANPDAQKIGQAELAELSRAIGLPSMPRDATELLYKLFTAKVKVIPERFDKDAGKTYDAKNEIKRYMPYGQKEPAKAGGGNGAVSGASAAPANGGAPASQPATQQAAGRRPWDD